MPLTKCPDCGKEVSSRAPSCPSCGAPIAAGSIADVKTVHGRGEGVFMKSMNCGCIVALVFAVIVALLFAYGLSEVENQQEPAAVEAVP